MNSPLLAAVIVVATVACALSQDESALKRGLEANTVVVRIDMPATQLGVDVYPDRPQPVDFKIVAQRLKEYGTGIHMGDSQVITVVKVKKDHIEVHLGGGGYGTFVDSIQGPSMVQSTYKAKSGRERDLEDQLRWTSDDYERRRLQRRLDDLRRDRERDDASARASAAIANRMAEQEIRQRRAGGGSRFNLRFEGTVPSDYLTPATVLRALAKYARAVDDDQGAGEYDAPALSGRAGGSQSSGLDRVSQLKKGLGLKDVERLLGPAANITNHDAGSLQIQERVYNISERQIVARFTNEVLIEYLVQSR